MKTNKGEGIERYDVFLDMYDIAQWTEDENWDWVKYSDHIQAMESYRNKVEHYDWIVEFNEELMNEIKKLKWVDTLYSFESPEEEQFDNAIRKALSSKKLKDKFEKASEATIQKNHFAEASKKVEPIERVDIPCSLDLKKIQEIDLFELLEKINQLIDAVNNLNK